MKILVITSITIPIPPVTKKNSARAFVNRKTGRTVVLPSASYSEYEAAAARYLPKLHIAQRVNVRALYYVKTRRRVDKTNLESALMDALVHGGTLADDSAINPEIVVSTDGSRVFVDKLNPRTEVTIESMEGKL